MHDPGPACIESAPTGPDMWPVQGETGSYFATAIDLQSMADIAAYARGDINTGTAHNPLQVDYMDALPLRQVIRLL